MYSSYLLREGIGILQRDEEAGKCIEYWEENKEAFQNLSGDTYEAIVTLTSSGQLLEDKKTYMNDEGGIDMCKAFEGMILMGEQKMMRLIQCMTEAGEVELIPRIASEPSFYQEMLKKYHIENKAVAL